MPEQYYRYPKTTALTIDAFQSIDLAAVLQDIPLSYQDMWSALAASARAELKAGEYAKARVLWLLSDLCSFMLNPSNANEPLRPFAILEDKRSIVVSDLAPEELAFITDLADELDNGLLKARISELLWITPGHRHIKHAQAAVEGYQVVPLSDEVWWQGGKECWNRALMLAKAMGKGGRACVEQLKTRLYDALDEELKDPSPMLTQLASTVLEHRLTHSQAADLPQKLEQIGRASELEGELFRARRCFELSMEGYRAARDQLAAARMTAAVAQTWVTEATLRGEGEGAQPLIALNHLEKALQIYRGVPLKFRTDLGVVDILTRLRKQIAEAGSCTVEMMHVVSTPSMDISDLVSAALEQVAGKTAIAALHAFTVMYPFARPAQARAGALKTLRVGLLGALSGATHVDRSGRVIAKTNPMSMSAVPTASDEDRIWAEMVKGHAIIRELTVHGGVLPALSVMQREHCYKEQDLISIAQASALVPPERAVMTGKGLYWGIIGDFGVAAHFLIPQLENIVRYHMKAAGLNTSNTDLEGIENENGLSTLMEVAGVEELFSAEVVFEIKALFCSPFGPNLRNAFAHGLMDDDEFYSAAVVYAWWFMLKWVAMPYWRQLGISAVAGAEGEGTERAEAC
jgi:hypothetical protein